MRAALASSAAALAAGVRLPPRGQLHRQARRRRHRAVDRPRPGAGLLRHASRSARRPASRAACAAAQRRRGALRRRRRLPLARELRVRPLHRAVLHRRRSDCARDRVCTFSREPLRRVVRRRATTAPTARSASTASAAAAASATRSARPASSAAARTTARTGACADSDDDCQAGERCQVQRDAAPGARSRRALAARARRQPAFALWLELADERAAGAAPHLARGVRRRPLVPASTRPQPVLDDGGRRPRAVGGPDRRPASPSTTSGPTAPSFASRPRPTASASARRRR